jgi:hypothetical protein
MPRKPSLERLDPQSPWVNRGRVQSLAPIVLFDVAGPLAVYYALCSAGLSTVPALLHARL